MNNLGGRKFHGRVDAQLGGTHTVIERYYEEDVVAYGSSKENSPGNGIP